MPPKERPIARLVWSHRHRPDGYKAPRMMPEGFAERGQKTEPHGTVFVWDGPNRVHLDTWKFGEDRFLVDERDNVFHLPKDSDAAFFVGQLTVGFEPKRRPGELVPAH